MTLPDSGDVSLFGQPFSRSQLPRIGYLPEERGLYKKMRVIDQLEFLGCLHGLSENVARRRAKEWCERLQISKRFAKKDGRALQRACSRRSSSSPRCCMRPELIIMDEPFTGLDPVNATLLMDTLMGLRSEGRTVLFSTHRMDQVEKFCDGIALISRGRLVLSGSMRSIKSRYPRNRVQIAFTGNDSGFLQRPRLHPRSQKSSGRFRAHARCRRGGPESPGRCYQCRRSYQSL